ncbi:MAG: prepilin-type N-terminal cleavage/methylation domain-containing protein [Thermoanaerobaculia bacterium]
MRPSRLLRDGKASRRGSSLIEVIVAMAILSIMVAGILQLYSLALLSSAAAAARTDLLFKCQQVVENIRFCYALTRRNPPGTPPVSSGVPAALTAGTYSLPYISSDSGWDYWGPDGANVMEQSAGPYQISYTVAHSSGSPNALWIITVTAIPTPRVAKSSAGATVSPTSRFFGLTLDNGKRVDYVAAFQ